MINNNEKYIIKKSDTKKLKDRINSFINSIPEQYKRDEYIIDKLKCNKKNVEK